ncbi:MAG TPA: phosphatidate cytidylyltransferase [Sphingorhabdus sp.]|jgi:phosphatidate cytidylyltransferase|uniref:phosphatidate cytidylyltransferase n=1 Tax=Sphingorhabdus sp. TaxID=1902408 RepID=UPI002CEC877A|nr:phosphatidate cytidylyltransferase [Sphingorhabdus sp.]HMT40578.1 phosphatidate cytidylyltransferase [Sphingorhabdus sp.]HMU22582.1 phosphatidate cytidylyltransferase [Sphingorhabdus sp.]
MSGDEALPKPRSDLGLRTLSGIAMLALALGAIWFGGWFFGGLIASVAVGVFFEWIKLVRGFVTNSGGRGLWYLGGAGYIGMACFALLTLGGVLPSHTERGIIPALSLIAMVIGTDIGAYFAGRTFGGPKIAPRISPSKTWSGLFGGMTGAAVMLALTSSEQFYQFWTDQNVDFQPVGILPTVFAGVVVAATAQAGDFFESWMKRRAGMKDSGSLIPGHGGLFDRVDGLLGVSFIAGILILAGVA